VSTECRSTPPPSFRLMAVFTKFTINDVAAGRAGSAARCRAGHSQGMGIHVRRQQSQHRSYSPRIAEQSKGPPTDTKLRWMAFQQYKPSFLPLPTGIKKQHCRFCTQQMLVEREISDPLQRVRSSILRTRRHHRSTSGPPSSARRCKIRCLKDHLGALKAAASSVLLSIPVDLRRCLHLLASDVFPCILSPVWSIDAYELHPEHPARGQA
jgi:hypothetical protein